jgi:hypothetical protein
VALPAIFLIGFCRDFVFARGFPGVADDWSSVLAVIRNARTGLGSESCA